MSITDEKLDKLIRGQERMRKTQLSHSEILNKHSKILNKHSEILNKHSRILNKHDKKLNKHENRLDKHDRRFDQIDVKLKEHDKRFDRLTSAVLENRKDINEIKQTMATKDDIRNINHTLEHIVTIVESNSQEIKMFARWALRVDKDIADLKART